MGKLVLQTIGGINRLRQKGGVSRTVLYDLVNGYITADDSAESRPGTETHATLPSGTKGLMAFDGGLVVFSHEAKAVPSGYTCEIVIHPTEPTTALLDIHFAGPFLGYPYVVAEFADGATYHYWLQRRSTWEAETAYGLGDVVEPTVPNGYAYRAKRLGAPAVVWAPDVPRVVGDRVEPTEPNGFIYEVTDVTGASPRSGDTEPTWPEQDGATVYEDTDLTPAGTVTLGVADPSATLPDDVIERYGTGYAGISGILEGLAR